ncbi:MAG: hypothetical protein ACJ71P_15605 [Nitrososphaeraceae archaeon]
MIRNSALRVNMGCMDKEACHMLSIHKLLEWGLEDPKGKSIEKVREIRDDIEQGSLQQILLRAARRFLRYKPNSIIYYCGIC